LNPVGRLRAASVAAFALMVLGIVLEMIGGTLIARSAAAIAVQGAAVCLMLWARVTFGRRSFHAAADPTAGGLVTTGPYRFVRHPIYAAVIYFVWAGALDHGSLPAAGAAVLVTAGAVLRMLAEEHLLVGRYPAYAEYKARTARVVPYVI
jgi:protein-S-isoprenylcysteine O-methyltransferase Ste14